MEQRSRTSSGGSSTYSWCCPYFPQEMNLRTVTQAIFTVPIMEPKNFLQAPAPSSEIASHAHNFDLAVTVWVFKAIGSQTFHIVHSPALTGQQMILGAITPGEITLSLVPRIEENLWQLEQAGILQPNHHLMPDWPFLFGPRASTLTGPISSFLPFVSWLGLPWSATGPSWASRRSSSI